MLADYKPESSLQAAKLKAEITSATINVTC